MYNLMTGILIGIAIRTGSPLSLNIAEPTWKQLAGMPLSISDLSEIDKDFVPGRIIVKVYVPGRTVLKVLYQVRLY